ncbi:MAG TPA: UDP-N-acetylmuramoyl-L-alanyl-D-glutamate--2,6-diaminopimelate ligase [Blastocatellia bacterium]|nr:UDP-N-acetylmuramoyl-L-alanyl-D-glutamate--2,6-diaminopimelate ligase [Blastocatellia bacterium]
MSTTLLEIASVTDGVLTGSSEIVAQDITHDSRRCGPGTIFVAIKGLKVNGNKFVPQAIERGSNAIISEDEPPKNFSGGWIQVRNPRQALAQASAAVFKYPTKQLKLVGITGTNGKTTTAHLVDSIIRAHDGISAIMGTINARIGTESVKAEHTTPEASEVQRFLRRAVDTGAHAAVMEVSSHSLDMHRVDACRFEVAAFTNLTRDHLDYHGTMDDYFAVKRRLFNGEVGSPRYAIINIDDPRGNELVKASTGTVITYGLKYDADVKTDMFSLTLSGLNFIASTPKGSIHVSSPLVGRPHVYNILAAIGIGIALGYDQETIETGINTCPVVEGRFERVPCNEDFAVIVDYAHTDDALRNVLKTAREVARNRIITVFGCGGDRDRTKRPLMGQAAARFSDVVIVTSDNPRSEDPMDIIAEIEPGLESIGKPYLKIPDRREAIHRAIKEAQPGDLVLLAGKGHEDYQVLKDRTLHFDDREVAREALAARRAGVL